MANKEIRLDAKELADAIAGRTIFLVGAGIFILLYAGMIAAASVSEVAKSLTPSMIQLLTFGLSGFSTLILATGAIRARNALGLPLVGIILGCLFSVVIPCFFLVMVISLLIRFTNYFTAWRTYMGPSWSPKPFLASEAGQNWQTVWPGRAAR
jgi:hypothetical protein